MPREIVLGNGELLVNLDKHLQIRDIYYPYVGWANHVGGYRCRVGVWVSDGGMAWLDDGWEWDVKYEENTLVTNCAARHKALGVRLRAAHSVLADENVLLTRYQLENLTDAPREARLFLAHDLRIDESDIGDTAFYSPYLKAMVHYKRDRYFLFGGDANGGIWEYACGEKGFRGAEGAWRDAEDGRLSGNAIAQGSVDSVHSFSLPLDARGTATARVWMVAGESLEDVGALQEGLAQETFDAAFAEAGQHWRRLVEDVRPDLDKLPPRVAELFTRSLLIIRTQTDKRGAILASNDSDIMETARAHYSYLWPRDGALVCQALDRVGLRGITQPFFEFCARVLPSDRAALMHKYGPDGTVGASWHPWVVDGKPEIPFQEDGTALVVSALWAHVQKYPDAKFAARMYEKFARPAADFLRDFRHPQTKLPLPSWDIWEERRGTHIWTTASVVAALRDAALYAAHQGDVRRAERWAAAAEETRQAMLTHLWDEEAGYFARMAATDDAGNVTRDMTADSSAYGVFGFGVLPADDPKVVSTMSAFGRRLWVKSNAGGLARYERDYYFRVSDDFDKVPGNPWIICTLWLADWYVAIAKTPKDLRSALDLLEWASLCASGTGVLSEQVHPFTLQPLSVAPLTWSHAQFVKTASDYLDKLAILGG